MTRESIMELLEGVRGQIRWADIQIDKFKDRMQEAIVSGDIAEENCNKDFIEEYTNIRLNLIIRKIDLEDQLTRTAIRTDIDVEINKNGGNADV